MKVAKLLIPVILLVSGSMLFGADFPQYGMTVLSTASDTVYTEYRVRDGNNHVFDVLTREPLSDAEFQALNLVTGTIYKFQYIKAKSMRVVFAGDRINVILVPLSFTYQDKDFMKYLPSGLQFYFGLSLEYDFRILVNNLTLKIAGEFFTETQLCERLVSAVSNPLAFLLSSNPEYLMEKITGLQQTAEEFRAYGIAATQEFNKARGELDATMENLEETEANLEETRTNLEETKAELTKTATDLDNAKSDLEKTNTELADLSASHDSLATDYTDLLGNYHNLQKAVILVANQGIFSTIKKFNVAAVERAIEAKKENPELDDKALVAKLKGEGVSLSPKEAFLVNQVFYFNWLEGEK